MYSPLSWYGGKYILSKEFVKFLPPNITTYVEVFGGGGSLLFNKSKSEFEVYNDLDSNLVNFFTVLRDNMEELVTAINLTPYSRQEFKTCYYKYKDKNVSCLERARRFFVVNQQSFSSIMTSGSFSVSAGTVNTWNNLEKRIIQCANRFKQVLIENLAFEKIFEKYDSDMTLFYVDPPYVPDSRKSKNVYDCELSQEQHVILLDILKNVKGFVLLSGYHNNLYDNQLFSWKVKEYSVVTSVNNSSKEESKRVEVLWINNRFDVKNNILQKFW